MKWPTPCSPKEPRAMPRRYQPHNPLVRFVEQQRQLQGWSVREVARRAGVGHRSLYYWRLNKQEPAAGSLEAVMNVLGYTLTPMPLPPDPSVFPKQRPIALIQGREAPRRVYDFFKLVESREGLLAHRDWVHATLYGSRPAQPPGKFLNTLAIRLRKFLLPGQLKTVYGEGWIYRKEPR